MLSLMPLMDRRGKGLEPRNTFRNTTGTNIGRKRIPLSTVNLHANPLGPDGAKLLGQALSRNR